jgi:hypothetical protein
MRFSVSALLGDGPVLILCPATLTTQWQIELKDRPLGGVVSGEKAWRLDPDEIPMPSIGVGARGLPRTFDRPFGLRERQSRFIKAFPAGVSCNGRPTTFDESRSYVAL